MFIILNRLGSSGTTPLVQQNGSVPTTNGPGGGTHSDETEGSGPAGNPTQAQQNQSTSNEPLPAG